MRHCKICHAQLLPEQKITCDNGNCLREQRQIHASQMREYRRRNPEKYRAVSRKSHKKNGQRWKEGIRLRSGLELISCLLCGRKFENISKHLPNIHGITTEQYRELFPGSETLTEAGKLSRARGSLAQAKRNTYQGREPDDRLFEYLTGALLGDGSLELRKGKTNARYAEGGNNKEYLRWKHEFLSEYFYCTFKERLSSPHSISNKRYLGWWVRTAAYPILTKWRDIWYRGKKLVPRNIIEQHLTPFAFSVWFCDDGHMGQGMAALYTMAFQEKDVVWLADLLHQRFDLSCSILKNNREQPFMRFHARSIEKIAKILVSSNLPGMDYKQG